MAQADGVPVHGIRPTTSWRPGEAIIDERSLAIPPDILPGAYHLWIGLYEPEAARRLPLFVDGERQADDRLLLKSLVIGQ